MGARKHVRRLPLRHCYVASIGATKFNTSTLEVYINVQHAIIALSATQTVMPQ